MASHYNPRQSFILGLIMPVANVYNFRFSVQMYTTDIKLYLFAQVIDSIIVAVPL